MKLLPLATCLLLLLVLLSKCRAASIVVAFPVEDYFTETLMTAISVMLAKAGHAVVMIPPFASETPKHRMLNLISLGDKSPRKRFNYLEMDKEEQMARKLEALEHAKERVEAFNSMMLRRGQDLESDIFIVPLSQGAVVDTLVPNRTTLVTVCVEGYPSMNIKAASFNWNFVVPPHLMDVLPRGPVTSTLSLLTHWMRTLLYTSPVHEPRQTVPLLNDHHVLSLHGVVRSDTVLVPLLHIKPTVHYKSGAADAEVEAYCSDATAGLIYVNLGWDNLLPRTISNEIFQTLQSRRERAVWDNSDLPVNFTGILQPRDDSRKDVILSCVQTVVFVSRCNQADVQSAVYHEVPLLCMPLTAEERHLAAIYTLKRRATTLHWSQFNYAQFTAALDDVIHNETYKKHMVISSRMLRTSISLPPGQALLLAVEKALAVAASTNTLHQSGIRVTESRWDILFRSWPYYGAANLLSMFAVYSCGCILYRPGSHYFPYYGLVFAFFSFYVYSTEKFSL